MAGELGWAAVGASAGVLFHEVKELAEGVECVRKCKSVGWYNIKKKFWYIQKLEELDRTLELLIPFAYSKRDIKEIFIRTRKTSAETQEQQGTCIGQPYRDASLKHDVGKVYLWPASTTTGTKAGRTVQIILNLAGFKNVKSKEFFAEIWTHFVGSKNRHNTVKFVFKALNEIETSKNVLLLRSIWFDGDVCD
ncbi:hypothetical protein FEM48_Zijuj03G0186900 [Ziziphus jujuba var. spinosa]|uniref:Uncharacterized protein n=1 Tax=Ziziphus jujuba var. spinosa TaxID=714518 RepID=A0A978VRZ3_ZIZJJ|nr:hypothetical protein FEM48_Zijuj03G0186900 [Ziziphus jujuba var. spinosa]